MVNFFFFLSFLFLAVLFTTSFNVRRIYFLFYEFPHFIPVLSVFSTNFTFLTPVKKLSFNPISFVYTLICLPFLERTTEGLWDHFEVHLLLLFCILNFWTSSLIFAKFRLLHRFEGTIFNFQQSIIQMAGSQILIYTTNSGKPHRIQKTHKSVCYDKEETYINDVHPENGRPNALF